MAIIINGTDVIKEAAAQATGVTWVLSDGSTVTGTDVAALDQFDLTDIGRNVLDAGGNVIRNTTESFMNAMISVISRIELDLRPAKSSLSSLEIKDEEWGGFIERVEFELADMITDPKWNLYANFLAGKKDYAAEEHGFYPIKARAKLYEERIPVLTPVSYPVDQLAEACRNEEEMRTVINGIRAAVRRTQTAGLNSIKHVLAQSAIAVSIANTGTAVNLLARWQAETGDTSVTVNNWRSNNDFVAFCLSVISETADNFEQLSVAFNDGVSPTSTDASFRKLILLNKFDKIARFGVKASTFNERNLAIGDYETVTSWQGYDAGGTAQPFDFESVSKIMIDADPNDKLGIGTSAFTQGGVVALMFDRYALGLCPFKQKVTSQYTAIGDYLNEFNHLLTGTILDTHYNMVAFYIATP